MKVTLIIPAHNEEARLRGTLLGYARALHAYADADFEIIVVANACTDGTAPVAAAIGARIPQVRVVDVPERIGKGGAILEGFRHARGQKVVFADADGSTAGASLVELLDLLDGCDIAIGSRRLRGSVISRRQPRVRRIFSGLFSVSVRLLYGMPYRDTQCGAKAFRDRATRSLEQFVQERFWVFDVDLLLCARTLGFTVVEHPVVWAHSPGSHLHVLRAARDVLPALWRLRRRSYEAPAQLLRSQVIELEAREEDHDGILAHSRP